MPKAYEEAGVSVEAGYEVVKRIKSHVARTNRPGVVGGIGGFGGLFDLASLGYKEPVLISGTDGVGTKLVVAKMANKHDTPAPPSKFLKNKEPCCQRMNSNSRYLGNVHI